MKRHMASLGHNELREWVLSTAGKIEHPFSTLLAQQEDWKQWIRSWNIFPYNVTKSLTYRIQWLFLRLPIQCNQEPNLSKTMAVSPTLERKQRAFFNTNTQEWDVFRVNRDGILHPQMLTQHRYQGPFVLMILYCNSNIMENLYCCNFITDHLIATNFCTCHDSTAVMACAKFCSKHFIRI